jgi:transposase-like protein
MNPRDNPRIMRKRQPRKIEAGSILAPHFHNEDAAREYLEKMRWPDGPICPHCGLIGEAYSITVKEKTFEEIKATGKRIRKARKGLWKCAGCRKQFTVTVKTIFADSHIPLHKWLLAIHLMCSSKKGISAHQLMRNLEIKQYKSAWFMAHRIRYAMTGELPEKMGGTVEMDETYIGGKRRNRQSSVVKPGQRAVDRLGPVADKQAVVSILQRDGNVRSVHVEKVTAKNLKVVLDETCTSDVHLMTDTSSVLAKAGRGRKHSTVNHTANEYGRWEDGVCVTTNGVEGYFSILKRGINGVFHHVSKQHLHRYLSEFDFRHNARKVTDGERARKALDGFADKRLMHKDPIRKQS